MDKEHKARRSVHLGKSSKLMAILLWIACLGPATAAQTAAGPIKVFILAGQSNMEGQGVADLEGKDYNDGKGTLKSLLQDPEKATRFGHLKAASGSWAVRADVWVRYQREQKPLLKGALTVGYSV